MRDETDPAPQRGDFATSLGGPRHDDDRRSAAGASAPIGRDTTPAIERTRAAPAARLLAVSCRRGRRTVLRDINLEIASGVVTGILGPNAAGKSTLLGVISDLLPVAEGQAWVLGENLPVRGPRLRQRIGVMLQETALYDELTARQNLRFTASLYGVPNREQRIDDVLELLGLEHRARETVGTLSGGLRRRLTLARALLHEPELLIIDEPTLGVDAEARHAIWAHIRLLRTRGTTVIVATNYLDEVQALCDTAAVLRDGRLIAHEAPSSLVARAGQCIDVECRPDAVEPVLEVAAALAGVTRAERTLSGAAIYVRGGLEPESIVRRLMQDTDIGGFRVRAVDLAEVFRIIDLPEGNA